MTAAGIDPCRTDEGAVFCTEAGLAAAHAAYRARLRARARRIVIDPDLAEDVVQEAFLRAWRACASFDPAAGPLVNWLLVITANTAIDMVKARVRRPPLASGPADENIPAASPTGIDLFLLRSELRDALASLSADHRAAVVETVLRDGPTPTSRPSLACRRRPCAPGSTTGSGGCAACSRPSRPRTQPPDPDHDHYIACSAPRPGLRTWDFTS